MNSRRPAHFSRPIWSGSQDCRIGRAAGSISGLFPQTAHVPPPLPPAVVPPPPPPPLIPPPSAPVQIEGGPEIRLTTRAAHVLTFSHWSTEDWATTAHVTYKGGVGLKPEIDGCDVSYSAYDAENVKLDSGLPTMPELSAGETGDFSLHTGGRRQEKRVAYIVIDIRHDIKQTITATLPATQPAAVQAPQHQPRPQAQPSPASAANRAEGAL